MKRVLRRHGRRRLTFLKNDSLRSDRGRVEARVPRWLATLLGPYPDEVGWRHVIAKWLTIGAVFAAISVAAGVGRVVAPIVAYSVSGLLFLIAVLTT